MNLSNEYMIILDDIRIAKKMTVSDLCNDIITDRTYYRMLKAEQVKVDVFSLLTERLGLQLTELIHHAVFVKKNDSRFKFIYRVHTQFFSDILEHYEIIRNYQDSDEDLNLLLQVYVKKYEVLTGKMTSISFNAYLESLIPLIQQHESFNIYLFNIKLFIIEELEDKSPFSIKDCALELVNEEFSYSVILMACCYDLLLNLWMRKLESGQEFTLLFLKYEKMIAHFPSRYFMMRYNLYHAYHEKIKEHIDLSHKYLFKYFVNALSMVEDAKREKEFKEIRDIFQIDEKEFLLNQVKNVLLS